MSSNPFHLRPCVISSSEGGLLQVCTVSYGPWFLSNRQKRKAGGYITGDQSVPSEFVWRSIGVHTDWKFDWKHSKLSLFFLEKATIKFKPALSIFCRSSFSSACHLSEFGFNGLVLIEQARLGHHLWLYILYVIEKTTWLKISTVQTSRLITRLLYGPVCFRNFDRCACPVEFLIENYGANVTITACET